MGHRANGKKIIKVFPNGIKTIDHYEGIEIYHKYQFFTRPEYAMKIGKVLFWLPVGEFYKGLILRPAYQLGFAVLIGIIGFHFPIFMATSTDFYSYDAGDGVLAYYGGDPETNWATAHDATSANYTYASLATGCRKEGTAGRTIRRSPLPFNTSALADTDIIDSATLNLYYSAITANLDNDGDNYHSAVAFTGSATSLTAADYDLFGTTKLTSDISLNDIVTSQYNVFTLNATGLSAISKTSYTKLGMREGHDILNHDIVASSKAQFNFANEASNKPKLTVVSHAPTLKTINGIAKASIKTWNGIPIASLKSWNGLD